VYFTDEIAGQGCSVSATALVNQAILREEYCLHFPHQPLHSTVSTLVVYLHWAWPAPAAAVQPASAFFSNRFVLHHRIIAKGAGRGR